MLPSAVSGFAAAGARGRRASCAGGCTAGVPAGSASSVLAALSALGKLSPSCSARAPPCSATASVCRTAVTNASAGGAAASDATCCVTTVSFSLISLTALFSSSMPVPSAATPALSAASAIWRCVVGDATAATWSNTRCLNGAHSSCLKSS